MVTREEMLEYKDEWLARKDELTSRFADSLEDPAVDAAIGMSLMGAGIGTIIMNLIRGKRSAWAYLIPGVFLLGGIAVISGGALGRRNDRIAVAEEVVREELAKLDPVARAQVLRDAASNSFGSYFKHYAN